MKEVRENCTNNYHSPCCDVYHGAPLWAYVPASSKPVLPKQGSPSSWQQLLCSGFVAISVDAGFRTRRRDPQCSRSIFTNELSSEAWTS